MPEFFEVLGDVLSDLFDSLGFWGWGANRTPSDYPDPVLEEKKPAPSGTEEASRDPLEKLKSVR